MKVNILILFVLLGCTAALPLDTIELDDDYVDRDGFWGLLWKGVKWLFGDFNNQEGFNRLREVVRDHEAIFNSDGISTAGKLKILKELMALKKKARDVPENNNNQ